MKPLTLALLVMLLANTFAMRAHRARDEREWNELLAITRRAQATARSCVDTLAARAAADSAAEANGPHVGDTVRVTRPTPLWRLQ